MSPHLVSTSRLKGVAALFSGSLQDILRLEPTVGCLFEKPRKAAKIKMQFSVLSASSSCGKEGIRFAITNVSEPFPVSAQTLPHQQSRAGKSKQAGTEICIRSVVGGQTGSVSAGLVNKL